MGGISSKERLVVSFSDWIRQKFIGQCMPAGSQGLRRDPIWAGPSLIGGYVNDGAFVGISQSVGIVRRVPADEIRWVLGIKF